MAVKADPTAQRLLLDLQGLDTTLQQLAHRRARLPELAELEQINKQLSDLAGKQVAAQVEVDDLHRDIARIERDVEQVRARKERDSARLAAGTGPARELEALQHELESLNRRQRELEDSQLELMERSEQAQATVDQVAEQLAATRQRQADLVARRDASLAEITEQAASQTQAREPLVDQLPADLVRLYERIREDTGGLGAALLRGNRCGGCRLDLSGSERARITAAPPDEVVRCEECRRIMIRTNESGI